MKEFLSFPSCTWEWTCRESCASSWRAPVRRRCILWVWREGESIVARVAERMPLMGTGVRKWNFVDKRVPKYNLGTREDSW